MYTEVTIIFSKLPLELVQTVSICNTWAKIVVHRLLYNHSRLLFCYMELENLLVQPTNTTPEGSLGNAEWSTVWGAKCCPGLQAGQLPYPAVTLRGTQSQESHQPNKTISSLEALSFIHTIPFSRGIAEGWACLNGRWITPTLSQFNKVENMNETVLLIALAGSAGGV